MLNRIRVMGCREVVHRAYKSVTQILESVVLSFGWEPKLRDGSFDNHPLFWVGESDTFTEWKHNFDPDYVRLDKLVNGQIDLFSYTDVSIGKTVDWLREPVNDVLSPSSFGKSINYRDKRIVGDIKILWELGRQQYLVPVALGYLATKNPKYRNLIKSHIESWIESCPFGYTVHWCSSLEVALRVISWSIVHSLLIAGGEEQGLFGVINPEILRRSIYRHAWFIRNHLSLYSSANNHLIGEIVGLWTACRVFDLGRKGKCWAKYAGDCLEREANNQVYDDGVNKEQAIYYHAWVLEYLLFSYLVGKRVGYQFSDEYFERLKNMATFLSTISPLNGVAPQYGDADDGFVSRFSLDDSEDLYQDIISTINFLSTQSQCGNRSEKTFWYSIISGIKFSELSEDQKQPKTKYPSIFRQGGYAILGCEEMHIVFDSGALGYTSLAAHGHADALSVCIALDGLWWLVDSGTYAYHDDVKWRNYFRGTSAHNTVVIDGLDQSTIGGDFLWIKHANSEFLDFGEHEKSQWASGSHDGYESVGVCHTRRVEFNEEIKKVTINDSFSGNGIHEMSWHWHLAPEVTSEWCEENRTWMLRHADSERTLILTNDCAGSWDVITGEVDPVLGWYSEKLGRKVPSQVLRFTLMDNMPCDVNFSFALQN